MRAKVNKNQYHLILLLLCNESFSLRSIQMLIAFWFVSLFNSGRRSVWGGWRGSAERWDRDPSRSESVALSPCYAQATASINLLHRRFWLFLWFLKLYNLAFVLGLFVKHFATFCGHLNNFCLLVTLLKILIFALWDGFYESTILMELFFFFFFGF